MMFVDASDWIPSSPVVQEHFANLEDHRWRILELVAARSEAPDSSRTEIRMEEDRKGRPTSFIAWKVMTWERISIGH